MRRLLVLLSLLLLPQACVAVAAVSVAGDVVEGAAKTTVFTAKTAGKAAGAVLPGGGPGDGPGDEDERDEARRER